jgi:hypothetical protein
LVLALNGTVRAASIDVNNPSFEYNNDGNQVPGHAGFGSVMAWEENGDDPLGQMGWAGVDVMCPYADSAHCHRNPGPTDPCGTGTDVVYVYLQHQAGTNCYQILDMNNSDANAVIQEGRRYTLRWDALLEDREDNGNQVRGSLFYLADPCTPDVNHIELAGKTYSVSWVDRALAVCKGISNLDPTNQCPDWNYDLRADYVAPAGLDGNTLGIKLRSVGNMSDAYMFVDNVRLDWQWATQAYNPSPDDGATDVPKDANITWSPGGWAKDVNGHDVYFGSTWAEVNSATTASNEYQQVQSPNEFDPGTMVLGDTYYWRIDEVNENYTFPAHGPAPAPQDGRAWKGEIWSFTVAGRAKNPSPSDASVDVPKNVVLKWTAGAEALYHDVYYGTTESAVTTATTASGEYKDRTNLGTEEYDAGTNENPQVGEQYFWRIDEVNLITVKGNTWDFTVADFILVDDFDFYGNPTELRAVWKDSTVGLAGGSVVLVNNDSNYAVGDGNSMLLEYWNTKSPYYSETTRTYASGQNWSYAGNGVTELEIDWIGDANNAPDPPMYVKLSDGSTTVQVNPAASGYGPNDVTDESEHTWHIPLKDFSPVTLSSITKITLGIGDLKGEGGGAAEQGTLYFDDIRLYPPRCSAEFGPTADFTGDCKVDMNDLRFVLADWLKIGNWGPPTPVVEYLFEEGSGVTVANTGSLGSDYDLTTGLTWTAGGGTESCPNNDPCWENDADPCRGWTMWFDGESGRLGGGDYLIIPPMNLNSNAVTIAAWLKPDPNKWNAKTSVYEQRGSFSGIVHNRRGPADTDAGHETAAGMSYGSGSGWVYDGMLGYVWNDNSSGTWAWDSDLIIPEFQWSMNVMVVEPTQATMYLYDPTATPPLSSATNAIAHSVEEFDWRTVIAGDGGGGGDRFWRGQMDAVRVYGFP